MGQRAKGVAITLVGATMWGFSGTCSQYLFQHYAIAPLLVTVIRMLGAAAAFLALLLVRQRAQLAALVHDGPALRRVALFGVAGLFLVQVTYVVTIDLTNAGTATVLQAVNIVFCMLAALVAQRRGPRPAEVAALVASFAAVVLVATGGDLSRLSISPAGLAWGLATAVAAAFYITYPKGLFARWGSVPVTGLGMLVGGVAALVAWLLSPLLPASLGQVLGAGMPFPAMGADGWLALAAFTLVGTFLAFGVYLHGVSLVGGARASMLGTVEPVSAMVISAVWLGTPFTAADWVALVLMVATVILVSADSEGADAGRDGSAGTGSAGSGAAGADARRAG